MLGLKLSQKFLKLFLFVHICQGPIYAEYITEKQKLSTFVCKKGDRGFQYIGGAGKQPELSKSFGLFFGKRFCIMDSGKLNRDLVGDIGSGRYSCGRFGYR